MTKAYVFRSDNHDYYIVNEEREIRFCQEKGYQECSTIDIYESDLKMVNETLFYLKQFMRSLSRLSPACRKLIAPFVGYSVRYNCSDKELLDAGYMATRRQ